MLASPEIYRRLRRSFDRNSCRWKKRFLPELMYKQSGKCAYCEISMKVNTVHEDPQRVTLDHIHPLGKGGTNDRVNFVAACYACNKQKKNLFPLNFIWGAQSR